MKKFYSIEVNDYEIKEYSDNQFFYIDMYAISDKENRNKSEFLLESFPSGMSTIPNKPVLAYYNPKLKDVEEHNSRLDLDEFGKEFWDYQYETAEKPIGFIPNTAKITTEFKDGKNWIRIQEALIWTEYNKQLVNLLKKQGKKKISVEVEILDSYEENGVEKIKKWVLCGITLLGKFPNGKQVLEGIEGAHLSIKDYVSSEKFATFKKTMCFALNECGKNDILSKYGMEEDRDLSKKEYFISKDEYGTGSIIELDKNKDSVSNDSWGSVNKTSLRNEVLKAKNYKTLVKSVYLVVEDGWEESPSSKLKYPVMQLKDGKLVYNAGGLLSAQQYGEANDEAAASKAKRLRKKLGLLESEKREKMNKFIEMAKDSGLVFLGTFCGKLTFAKEEADMACDDKQEMSVFEIEKEKAEKLECSEDEDFAWDELTEKSLKLAEEEKEDDDDDDEEEDDEETKAKEEELESLKEECAAVKEKCASVEEEYASFKTQYESMKEELAAKETELKEIRMAKMKEDTDAILADEDEDMDEKTKEDLRKMRDDGKFSCVEDFEREVAYVKHVAEKARKEKTATFSLSTKKSYKSDETKDRLDLI